MNPPGERAHEGPAGQVGPRAARRCSHLGRYSLSKGSRSIGPPPAGTAPWTSLWQSKV